MTRIEWTLSHSIRYYPPRMNYTQQDSPEFVILSAEQPLGSVIWLHGLGADGYDFVPIVSELDLPAKLPLRFIFPHAPQRPVTINNGFMMPAWYDIKAIGLQAEEDEEGIRKSAAAVGDWVQAEIERGVPAERIVLAGFSQGGAIALHAALRHPLRLAGVMALSTYLPLRDSLAAEQRPANLKTPILMCHGVQDPVIPIAFGRLSRDRMLTLGYAVQWHEYVMQHQICTAEISDIQKWLVSVLSR